MGEFTPEDGAHQVYAVHVYVHHSHTDRTYSHHLRQQSAIPLSSRFFLDRRVLRCRGVRGILAKCTRDMSSAAIRRYPMVLGDTASVTCARISSLVVATAARTMCLS